MEELQSMLNEKARLERPCTDADGHVESAMASLTGWMYLRELWELVVDRDAWHAAIHGVSKSRTQLRD